MNLFVRNYLFGRATSSISSMGEPHHHHLQNYFQKRVLKFISIYMGGSPYCPLCEMLFLGSGDVTFCLWKSRLFYGGVTPPRSIPNISRQTLNPTTFPKLGKLFVTPKNKREEVQFTPFKYSYSLNKPLNYNVVQFTI